MGTVSIPDGLLAAAYGGGNYLVKFSVPTNQELHIFFLLQELAYQRFKTWLHEQGIFDYPMAEERDRICVQIQS